MDRDTRNLLFNTTQALRRGLEEEFALQLEGTYDIMPDGTIAATPPSNLTDREKLTRRKIVESIQHRRAAGESDLDSVAGFLREAAFTFLNRLAALKMMEARGIVQECVSACDSQGFNARGFKEFSGLAPGLIELPDGGYRLYLAANKSALGVARDVDTSDFHVECIDLLGNKVDGDIGVAFLVACYSILRKASPVAGLLVMGDLSIQGNIKPVRSLVEPLQVAMDNGARKALVPIENKRHFLEVSADVIEQVDAAFYGDIRTALMKGLEMS